MWNGKERYILARKMHYVCHCELCNYFVYVYYTSEMCTAVGVLTDVIINQYKRSIMKTENKPLTLPCNIHSAVWIFFDNMTSWILKVHNNKMANFCREYQSVNIWDHIWCTKVDPCTFFKLKFFLFLDIKSWRSW